MVFIPTLRHEEIGVFYLEVQRIGHDYLLGRALKAVSYLQDSVVEQFFIGFI